MLFSLMGFFFFFFVRKFFNAKPIVFVFVRTTLQQHAVWRPITSKASERSLEHAVKLAVFVPGEFLLASWLLFLLGGRSLEVFSPYPPISQYMLLSYYLVTEYMHFVRCSF